MMRNELEDRLGYPLEDWQWEIAHEVYQKHSHISDVHGKDQITGIIRMGFDYPFGHWALCGATPVEGRSSGMNKWEDDPIMKMYREIEGKPVICKTNHWLTYTEDVTTEGHCINFRPNLLKEISQEVMDKLEKDHHSLVAHLEYWSVEYGPDPYGPKAHDTATWPKGFPRIAVFYVRGGSEGYYVHVEALKDGKHKNIFLAKTLLEGEGGVTWAERMVCALSRILDV
jgi:hypothetical protein